MATQPAPWAANPMRSLLALALLAPFAAPSAAQTPVSVTGRIEAAAAPPCNPTATHKLQGTEVHLVSSIVDLSTVPSYDQTFLGFELPGACPLIDVVSVSPAKLVLSHCNNASLGCPFTLDMCPSPASGGYLIWAAAGGSYLPIGPAVGTFLLDPASFVLIASGPSTAVCESVPVTVTGPPSLVGQTAFLQAAAFSGIEAWLSNLHEVTFTSPITKPCTSFACY